MAVYKRGAKGVFYMNFTVEGVRVTRSTGKFTKKEAKLVEAVEKKRMMVDGALSPREKRARMKFSEAIKKVYDMRWKNNKDGLKSYRTMELVMGFIGDQPISKIDEDIVAHLVLMMEGKGNKPATINRSLAGLKTVLKYHKQPWEHIKLKKESKGRIRVLSREEVFMVVDLLRNQNDTGKRSYFPEVADMVEVLVDTGCRLSEILNLKYEDINFGNNLLTIWINKGDKPRSIPMTRRVKNILQRRGANETKPFTINRDEAERAWRWTRKRMGLQGDPEFVLHALRHTTATRLIDKGIDLYTVKEWLGHSTIQVTERYAHLTPDKLVHAANMLETNIGVDMARCSCYRTTLPVE